MLKDFKDEWNAIWSSSEDMKTGIKIKDDDSSVTTQLAALKKAVGGYQQFVAAFNTAQEEKAQQQLADRALGAFADVRAAQSALHDAISAQMTANTAAPKGALQMPQNYPDKVCNPGLEKLDGKIAAAFHAMEADLLSAGLGRTEDDTAETALIEEDSTESHVGTAFEAAVSEYNYPAPNWLADD